MSITTMTKLTFLVATQIDIFAHIFDNNKQWRQSVDPKLFKYLAEAQTPQILWIGCSDSRCPETTLLGLQPGDVFVHRNVANILTLTDLSSQSVIQFAVQYLRVKHIVVCGHTACGGVAGALGNQRLGLIDTWLTPLRALHQAHWATLSELNDEDKALRLVELNVQRGIQVLRQTAVVSDALAAKEIQLHGMVYNVGTGELTELSVEEHADEYKARKGSFSAT